MSACRLATVLCLAVACAPPPAPLSVDYLGCAHVFGPAERPRCVLSVERRLRLWTGAHAGTPLTVEAGEQRFSSADAEPVGGGHLFRLEDVRADEIVVRVGRDAVFRLPLVVLDRAPEVEEAAELIADPGRWNDRGARRPVRERLERRLAEDLSPSDRAFAASLLARFEAKDGELGRSVERLAEAARRHRELGHLSDAIADLTLRHFYLFDQLDDPDGAREALAALPEPAAGDARSAYLAAFFRGQWAAYTGSVRTTLRELETAAGLTRRLAMTREHVLAGQALALQLRRLGRHRDAEALLERLRADADQLDTDCERSGLLNDIAWDRLMALEAGLDTAAPLAELERARQLVEDCGDDGMTANVENNRALAALYAGRTRDARGHLESARQLMPEPRLWLRVWWLDIEGRIALAEGRPERALGLYEELGSLARQSFSAGSEWRATVGRARALEAAGRIPQALDAYAAAEDLLETASLAVPLGAGRETSLALFERGTRRYLDLLLREGRHERALEAARRSRSRILRGLVLDARLEDMTPDEKAAWVRVVKRWEAKRTELDEALAREKLLPGDDVVRHRAELERPRRELAEIFDAAQGFLDRRGLFSAWRARPSRPGEVLLVFHPLPEGWVAFAADGREVEVARFPELDAARLLAPFRDMIARAVRVRVLPYGPLAEVDFHALPFGGDVLLASAPVVYGLDLPRSGTVPPTARRALLVEDPTATLVAARSEIRTVGRTLGEAPDWDVVVLRGAAASAERVRRHLGEDFDLLHFAGHADFVGGGPEGGLRLSGGSRLTIGDILTREGLPSTVVLSACDTARGRSGDAPVGLGLGPAFLLGGSRAVVGAVREVDDRGTAALIERFYAALDGGASVPEALRRAQLALRHDDPAADWASFRVVER